MDPMGTISHSILDSPWEFFRTSTEVRQVLDSIPESVVIGLFEAPNGTVPCVWWREIP